MVDIVADVPAKLVGTVGIPFVLAINELDATEVPAMLVVVKEIV